MSKQILPAYPLFLKDPSFSVWSRSDELNKSDTMFWTGQERKTFGLVRANGLTYSFMGKVSGANALEQKSVSITAFTTDYEFTCAEFDLKVSFISPLTPDDLNLLSCPVCYLSYDVKFKSKMPDDFSVALVFDEAHCYDRNPMPVRGGVLKTSPYETGFIGLYRQQPLSQCGDSHAPYCGYTYVCADEAMFCSHQSLGKYINSGVLEYHNEIERKFLIGVNKSQNGKFMIGYDDICSINYYGDFLKGYYFKDGKNILDALKFSFDNYDKILTQLENFDKDLQAKAKPYGEEYLHILRAALRQSVAAHKLVESKKGEVLFLSKENHSNGCIATVDVSYPSTPLYLLYNPELVLGMLRPIFDFAAMPVWEYDFAPHDAGTYPYCCGQVYGMHNHNDKHHAKSICMRSGDGIETHLMFNLFPAGSGIYDFKYQMPVEECANMLIMMASSMAAGFGSDIAKANYAMLKKWTVYLKDFGLIPSNQLCTDDFAGHLDKNVNLSVKAIVGLASMGYIAEYFGEKSDAKTYYALAKDYAAKWFDMVKGYDPYPLSFDMEGSFSLKYNILFDKLLGFGLFDDAICEKELDTYIKNLNDYGTPLDTRADYTKSDWLIWAATLTKNIDKSKKLISALDRFLRESKSRVPFSDWYDTKTGKMIGFQNRSVQGGLFSILLRDSKKLLKK